MAKRCSEIHSATMPSRTKVQRDARLTRARDEEAAYLGQYRATEAVADARWSIYLDARELRRRLERTHD